MSTKTSIQSGMLTAYLYEKHVVAEQQLSDKKVDKKPAMTGQENSPASAYGGDNDQAVNELDKWMSENTDARILRKGKKMQKVLDKGRGMH